MAEIQEIRLRDFTLNIDENVQSVCGTGVRIAS